MSIEKMYQLFEELDVLIGKVSQDSKETESLLDLFCFRVFSILDGVEASNLSWKGVALVARENVPDSLDEINDDFLHDAWAEHRRALNSELEG